jgi:hypothetical protein
MAVYIWEDDAFEKMVQIEGETWRKNVKNFGECGFDAFKTEFDRCGFSPDKIKELIKLETDGMNFHFTVRNNSSIYGYDGWNRYCVRLSGEIIFLKAFCEISANKEKARELGFTIH